MKRSILLLGATFMIVLAATSQLTVAQGPETVTVFLQDNPSNQRGIQVRVAPWEAEIFSGYNCTWTLHVTGPGNVTVNRFEVRATPPRRNLPDLISGDTSVRVHGPFTLHPSCANNPNCAAGDEDPIMENYEIVIEVILANGDVRTVVIDPDHRVRP